MQAGKFARQSQFFLQGSVLINKHPFHRRCHSSQWPSCNLRGVKKNEFRISQPGFLHIFFRRFPLGKHAELLWIATVQIPWNNDVPQVLFLSDDIAAAYGPTTVQPSRSFNIHPVFWHGKTLPFPPITVTIAASNERGTTHGQPRKLVAEALERLLSANRVFWWQDEGMRKTRIITIYSWGEPTTVPFYLLCQLLVWRDIMLYF